MAWPRRIYVATKVSGVYYTDNFVGPDTQPTWTAVNTGLAATDCREFFLDPFHQAERQYVMLEASRSLYRREDGGAWSTIFDYDTAHTVLGSTPPYGETLYGFCVDPQTDGRLWVSYKYVYDPVGTYDYVFTSDDYGDSWSAILFYTGSSSDIQSPRCNGDSIFVPHVSGAGGAYHIQYTANAGANWSISTRAAFGWKTSIAVNPLTGIAYIEQDILATHDLAYLEDDGTTGTLQADITLSRNDAMWFDPTDADHQRLVHNSRLYVTTDSWANRNAPSAISYGVISIAPWAGNDTDQMLVGLTINHGVGQDHAVGALYGEADTSSQGIAGSSPGTPPYTDSIPYGCGGVCSMGVQAVEGAGVVHTYSVAMPGYAGTERGEPVPGDRASWETGVTHADDWDTGDSHHAAITIGTDAGELLELDGQEIQFVEQAANTVFAGPDSGVDADPTFRALVADDLPTHTHTEADISDLDHTDTDAIHDNVAGEIHAIDAKATPVGADELVIEDSADSWAKKRIALSDLPTGASALDDLSDVDAAAPNDGDVLAFNGADWVAAAPSSTTTRALLFSQVADVTVENTTTEETLLGGGRGSKTIPTDELVQGSVIAIVLHGHLSTTGTPNLTVRCDIGGTTICDTGVVAMNDTVYEVSFTVRVDLVCRATGELTGSMVGGGTFEYDDDSQHKLANISAVGVDTTAALAVDVTVEWGTASASNTISCQIATIELMKADYLAVASPSYLTATEV